MGLSSTRLEDTALVQTPHRCTGRGLLLWLLLPEDKPRAPAGTQGTPWRPWGAHLLLLQAQAGLPTWARAARGPLPLARCLRCSQAGTCMSGKPVSCCPPLAGWLREEEHRHSLVKLCLQCQPCHRLLPASTTHKRTSAPSCVMDAVACRRTRPVLRCTSLAPLASERGRATCSRMSLPPTRPRSLSRCQPVVQRIPQFHHVCQAHGTAVTVLRGPAAHRICQV
jgi:hypothetical protein